MKKLKMFNETHRRFLLFKPAGIDIRYILAHTKIFKNYLSEGATIPQLIILSYLLAFIILDCIYFTSEVRVYKLNIDTYSITYFFLYSFILITYPLLPMPTLAFHYAIFGVIFVHYSLLLQTLLISNGILWEMEKLLEESLFFAFLYVFIYAIYTILNVLTEHEFKVKKIRPLNELIVSILISIITFIYNLPAVGVILSSFIKITFFSMLQKLTALYLFKVGIKDSLLLISSTFLIIVSPLIFHALISGKKIELEGKILEIRELYNDVDLKEKDVACLIISGNSRKIDEISRVLFKINLLKILTLFRDISRMKISINYRNNEDLVSFKENNKTLYLSINEEMVLKLSDDPEKTLINYLKEKLYFNRGTKKYYYFIVLLTLIPLFYLTFFFSFIYSILYVFLVYIIITFLSKDIIHKVKFSEIKGIVIKMTTYDTVKFLFKVILFMLLPFIVLSRINIYINKNIYMILIFVISMLFAFYIIYIMLNNIRKVLKLRQTGDSSPSFSKL